MNAIPQPDYPSAENLNVMQPGLSPIEILFPKGALFPLSPDLFGRFLEMPSYQLQGSRESGAEKVPATDGEVLFHKVCMLLSEKGVRFSSPGNSPMRHFILWFNAHFINTWPYSVSLTLKEQQFQIISSIVVQLLKGSDAVQQAKMLQSASPSTPLPDDDRLTDMGRMLIGDLLAD